MRWPVFILPFLTACGPVVQPSFEGSSARARNLAIVEAASKPDQADLPALVRMLDAREPATRLLAIEALERATGERFGYEYAGPVAERQAAIRRWTQYAQSQDPTLDMALSARPASGEASPQLERNSHE